MNARITLEDYLALPDDAGRLELREGFVVAEPPPGFRHGDLASELIARLRAHASRTRAGRAVSEVSFVLGRDPDTVRIPDVAFLSTARVAALEDPTRPVPGPPDLAVEIASPSDGPGEIHAKVADYLAAGTPLVWVIDPDTRTVTTYRELLRPRRLTGSDRLEGEHVLPGFVVSVRELFES